MSWRRTISLLAVLAVLTHAIVVARHAVLMAAGSGSAVALHLSAEQALAADLGVICHVDIGGSEAPTSGLPPHSQPPGAPGKCPICLGLVAAVALDATAPGVLPPKTGPPSRLAPAYDQSQIAVARVQLPPVRGPPLA